MYAFLLTPQERKGKKVHTVPRCKVSFRTLLPDKIMHGGVLTDNRQELSNNKSSATQRT